MRGALVMPPGGHELDAAARIAAADIVGEVVATAPVLMLFLVARAAARRHGALRRSLRRVHQEATTKYHDDICCLP